MLSLTAILGALLTLTQFPTMVRLTLMHDCIMLAGSSSRTLWCLHAGPSPLPQGWMQVVGRAFSRIVHIRKPFPTRGACAKVRCIRTLYPLDVNQPERRKLCRVTLHRRRKGQSKLRVEKQCTLFCWRKEWASTLVKRLPYSPLEVSGVGLSLVVFSVRFISPIWARYPTKSIYWSTYVREVMSTAIS